MSEQTYLINSRLGIQLHFYLPPVVTPKHCQRKFTIKKYQWQTINGQIVYRHSLISQYGGNVVYLHMLIVWFLTIKLSYDLE